MIKSIGAIGLLVSGVVCAAEPLPVVVEEDFSQGVERWSVTDESAWKVGKDGEADVFELTKKKSDYQPPHRSPHNIALLKDVVLGDFVLEAEVKTTEPSYGHRSLCLFFGHQDPANFYYVHFGQKADDHANQIFVVNDAPRTKISETTTEGTPWEDGKWHRVKVVRTVGDGKIAIYFDDMEKPVMTATDKTFLKGKVGIGSFDDRGMWRKVLVRGDVERLKR